jgi:ketosteroid isomerase-like protein
MRVGAGVARAPGARATEGRYWAIVPSEAVQIVRGAYDAYNRGDLDELMTYFAEDAVMDVPVLGQIHRGQAAVRRSFEDYFEVVQDAHTEALEYIEDGDKLIVPVRLHGRLRHTGITGEGIATEMVHVFAVRDGKIVWNYICMDRHDAVEAARSRP